VIASRSAPRARALAARFARVATVVETYEAAVRDCSLVVNATPIGLRDDAMPVDPAQLPARTRVFDLAYRRGLTPWVVRARALGLEAEDGLGMLVEQGALAFERWFRVQPDRTAMWKSVE
jgi:shikimate dehydrogenase